MIFYRVNLSTIQLTGSTEVILLSNLFRSFQGKTTRILIFPCTIYLDMTKKTLNADCFAFLDPTDTRLVLAGKDLEEAKLYTFNTEQIRLVVVEKPTVFSAF